MTSPIARLAVLCHCLGCIAVADGPARTPAAILAEYDAVKVPTPDRSRAGDAAAINAYREEAARASARKAGLALELSRVAPDNPRVPDMLIERWVQTMMSPATAGATVAEIDGTLKHFKDPARRKVARQMKAIATVVSHPDDPKAALPEVDRFLSDYPKDPLGANLLNGFALSIKDPDLKRTLLKRLAAEFPDSPLAESAATALAALDLVGKPLDLDFVDAVGKKPVSLKSLKGRVVVLDFWATWCGPCVASMPALKALNEKYKDEGLSVLGVNMDEGDEGREKMAAFVARNGLPWPQHHDGKGWESPLVERLGVRAIPALVVIDRAGNVAELDAHDRLAEVLPRYLHAPSPAR
ncbi:Thiol-disulfide oxidoreductase ResA [Aquisphaera giovannonii]|uniref:Thiol-disulfide oxidoreductase ResA n=1 Tax=Aquisphaera giovannonii TaxID=406548 RepID=A0A5B9WBX7_9BACT|nr:TlpA disulfide reductase family protein [Aquisphaera giovannonii]QEH38178.1 Thiol-disulfide oxidoreductase ResA [Aquisphaera giovannonii]